MFYVSVNLCDDVLNIEQFKIWNIKSPDYLLFEFNFQFVD